MPSGFRTFTTCVTHLTAARGEVYKIPRPSFASSPTTLTAFAVQNHYCFTVVIIPQMPCDAPHIGATAGQLMLPTSGATITMSLSLILLQKNAVQFILNFTAQFFTKQLLTQQQQSAQHKSEIIIALRVANIQPAVRIRA